MKTVYKLFLSLFFAFFANSSFAQVGYQVVVYDKDGAPKVNQSVTVEARILGTGKDSEEFEICTRTSSETTNELGILNLIIGDENTFKDVDWNKALPLYIEVKADDVLISKSQILNIPVAEYAKKAGLVLTPEYLEGTWSYTKADGVYDYDNYYIALEFKANGEVLYKYVSEDEADEPVCGTYEIDGDVVFVHIDEFKGICRINSLSKKLWVSFFSDSGCFLTKEEK